MGIFDKLKEGLLKTRKGITEKIDQLLVSFGKVDEELFEELEEILLSADIGLQTSMFLTKQLRQRVRDEKVTNAGTVKQLLKEEIYKILVKSENRTIDSQDSGLRVMVVIGVNGVGKTTSIGKICSMYTSQGKKVIVAAADTFRAAAIDQLEIWVKRAGAEMIRQSEGSDPAAVVYDAIVAAKSRKADLLICDTAGRLHTKKNLMEELKKIFRIIERELPEANLETYLVLDATTGQNAVNQAKIFNEAVSISGIILTKLDGTAKGGIIISIAETLGLQVRYVGVGEKIDDLQPFDAKMFADALIS